MILTPQTANLDTVFVVCDKGSAVNALRLEVEPSQHQYAKEYSFNPSTHCPADDIPEHLDLC